MSRMNSNIILAGQQPDIVNTLANSTRAAAIANQNQYQNALRQAYQQHGPGILSGDQNALNQLSRLDPGAAFGIQQANRQNARMDEQLNLRRQELDLKIKTFARTASAQEKAQVAAQMETAMKRLIPLYQAGNLEGINSALGEMGEPPLQSLDQFPAVASLFGDTLETLKGVEALTAPDKPSNDYEKYVARELKAGREPVDEFEYANRKRGNGITYETPDGGRIQIGGQQGPGFGKKAQNDLQELTINAGKSLSRLKSIQAKFKPEFQQLQTKAGMAWAGIKDWVGKATPDEQGRLREYTQYRSSAYNNMNATLKELSGAAVNEHEMIRLTQELPNPGAKPWEGDSPTEFKAKMDQSIANQQMAILRYQMWAAQGGVGSPWDIGTLDEFPSILADITVKLAQEARADGYTDDAVVAQIVQDRLAQEYGIGANE